MTTNPPEFRIDYTDDDGNETDWATVYRLDGHDWMTGVGRLERTVENGHDWVYVTIDAPYRRYPSTWSERFPNTIDGGERALAWLERNVKERD